jgi:hypothetical protein
MGSVRQVSDVKVMLVKGGNGKGISKIEKTGTSGLVDTYTITYTDGSKTTYEVTNGNGIDHIAKTSTSGTTDTYTIYYTNGDEWTYTVENGGGSVVSVTQIKSSGEKIATITVDGVGTDLYAMGNTVLTSTLIAGQTTVTFIDDLIDGNALFDIYVPSEYADLAYSSLSVSSHTLTVTFPAQSSDVEVKLRLFRG